MKRLPMFLVILVGFILFGDLVPEENGFRTICTDDQCSHTANGSLHTIFVALAMGILVFFLPRKEIEPNPEILVGIFRRLGALYLNVFVVMFPLMLMGTLPVLLIEAWHVGEFQWSFSRDFPRDTDFFSITASVVLLELVLAYYYYQALMRGRPTVGQYLMGYQIVSLSGPWTRSRALKRMGLTFLELCAWPVTAFLAVGRPKKAFWWDLKTESIAERFAYAGDEEALEHGP